MILGQQKQPNAAPQTPMNQTQVPTLAQYKGSGEELGSSELKWSMWYVKNKVLIGKIALGVLAAFAGVTILIGLGGWLIYFASGYWQDERMGQWQVAQFVNYESIQPSYSATDLVIGEVRAQNIDNKTSFWAKVSNSNERWYARVNYHFKSGDFQTKRASSVVLPGSDQFFASLANETGGLTGGVELIIDSVDWQRLNPHFVKDPAAFLLERVNFVASDMDYSLRSEDGIAANRLQFNLYNNTAYSYWDGDFIVAMYSGSQLIGLTNVKLEEFLTGETRAVDLRLFNISGSVNKIEVYPNIDILDVSAYMEP